MAMTEQYIANLIEQHAKDLEAAYKDGWKQGYKDGMAVNKPVDDEILYTGHLLHNAKHEDQ